MGLFGNAKAQLKLVLYAPLFLDTLIPVDVHDRSNPELFPQFQLKPVHFAVVGFVIVAAQV